MKHLVLIGLMGAGKTTVGRACAKQLGRDFVDTDDVTIMLAGMSVDEIFATQGEAKFREFERQAVADVCAAPVPLVIACGGGTVVDSENRKRLRNTGVVIWLQAPVAVLAARVGDGETRPLLRDDPARVLSRLEASREASYNAAADAEVETGDRTVADVTAAVLAAYKGAAEGDVVNRIAVDLGARSYTVTVGADAFAELPAYLRDRRRIAVVTQERIPASIVDRAVGMLRAAGPAVEVFFMGDGEDAKTLATIDDLSRWFAQWGLLRNDAIVAVGGGVVGDTAGFAAATYYRGIDVVHVPTTLLAMVDSAIGGKTGVNLPEGKNLVGAFHQPIAVLADPAVLATLPEREYKCGLGEIAKYALMQDLELDTDWLNVGGLIARDAAALTAAISASAAIKARYVEADELETSGVRAVLNYGHTLAHALETATGHALLHGEAVAIGLVFAGQLAGALERIDNAAVHRHETIVGGLGLPVQAPAGLRADDLLPIMARDKKSAGTLTFMLAGPTGIERVDEPDPTAVRKAFAAVGIEA